MRKGKAEGKGRRRKVGKGKGGDNSLPHGRHKTLAALYKVMLKLLVMPLLHRIQSGHWASRPIFTDTCSLQTK